MLGTGVLVHIYACERNIKEMTCLYNSDSNFTAIGDKNLMFHDLHTTFLAKVYFDDYLVLKS